MPTDEFRDAQGRTFSQAVADGVLAAMVSRGKSLREVARESGISRTRLHGRLHHERPFNTDELAAIAVVLGLDPRSFLGR